MWAVPRKQFGSMHLGKGYAVCRAAGLTMNSSIVDTLPLNTDCFKDVGGADGAPWELGEYFTVAVGRPGFQGKTLICCGR
jgi:hypothetical protein